MLNAPITLRPEQIKDFVQNLNIITQTFGKIPFSSGLTVETAIFNIKVISGLTILINPSEIEVTISKLEKSSKHRSKASKPDALKDNHSRQVTGCTLVSELVTFFMVNRAPLMGLNEKAYHQSMGFLMLMATLYGYNAAVTLQNTESHHLKQQYIDKSIDWMTIFESVNLPELGSDFWHDLRLRLVQSLSQLKAKPLNQSQLVAHPELILLPSELKQLIERKNLRAKQFGVPCEMAVIHRHDSNMLFQIDLDTFVLLKTQLEKIINTRVTTEHHFLFYVNHDFGPVELLSARYNTTTDKLELVNVSPGNRISQYYFLAALRSSLDAASMQYDLHACQANMLSSAHGSAFYAYLFSGILRSVAVSQVNDKAFKTTQPIFYDAFEQETKAFPTLKQVNWFDVGALGDKALLLAPDHESIKAHFLKRQPDPADAKKRFNFYMRKYNLVMSDLFEGNYRFYAEYAFHRAKSHLENTSESPSYMEMMNRILNDELDCEKEAQDLELLVKELESLKLSKTKAAPKNKASAKKSNQKKEVKLTPVKVINKKPDDVAIQAQEQDGKLLRRAAAGFCTLSEFEFLLEHPFMSGSIDQFDPKRQYTPLQLSLTHQQPKRALMLLKKEAKADLKSEDGKSARTIYEGLPADSPIKKNEKLKTFFKA